MFMSNGQMPPFCLCQKFANSGPNSSRGLTPWHQNTKALSRDENCLISPGHSAVLASDQFSLPCQRPVLLALPATIPPCLASNQSSRPRSMSSRLSEANGEICLDALCLSVLVDVQISRLRPSGFARNDKRSASLEMTGGTVA